MGHLATWPPEADYAMHNVPVKDAPGDGGVFVHTTPHFRFISNVNLGTTLVKDLTRVFELTQHLHTLSPFGILATPENGLFNARLYGNTADYMEAGGKPRTAGIYLLKEKVFMAPLELMMTDEEWITGRPPGTPAPPARSGSTEDPRSLRLPILYRTSHLILYYFIQIEAEKGVLKIRRFLEENRKFMARYLQQYLKPIRALTLLKMSWTGQPAVIASPELWMVGF